MTRFRGSNLIVTTAWSALCVLLSACLLLSYPAPATAVESGSEKPRGEALFTENQCSTCHGLSSLGIEAKVKEGSPMYGGDLAGAVSPDDDLQALGAFLRGETERDGAKHKKKIDLGEADMTALLDWLAEQKAP